MCVHLTEPKLSCMFIVSHTPCGSRCTYVMFMSLSPNYCSLSLPNPPLLDPSLPLLCPAPPFLALPRPLVVMLILFMGLFMFGPATEWGDVSQALIFYQVMYVQ